MLYQQKKLLNDFLFGFFALFIFGSTFSIALAQIALGMSLLLFIIVAVSTRYNPFVRELKWFYIFVGLYIVWLLISSLTGKTPVKSILIMKEKWLFGAVPVGIYLLSKDSYRRKLLAVFALGIGIFALYGLLQFFTGVHWTKAVAPNPGPEFGYVIKGNFPSPMTFGNYFATAGAFFAGYALAQWNSLGNKSRMLYGGTALVSVLATIGSYNRGAIIGLFVGFVVLSLILRRRKIAVGLGCIVILASVLIVAFPTPRERLVNHLRKELDRNYVGGRLFIWNNSLQIAARNPVFGVGQGNFRYEYLEYLPKDIPDFRKQVHAHNDFINIAAIGGIPGMVFFAGIWIVVFCYLRRQLILTKHGAPQLVPHPAFSGAVGSSLNDARPFLIAALTGSMVFVVSSFTESTFADEEVRQMLMFVWAAGLFALVPRSRNTSGTNHSAGSKSS